MKPSNWIIALCATGAHNYAAIIACILIGTALAPALAAASEGHSSGDESPAVARHVELSAASLDFLPYELASLDSCPSPGEGGRK